MFEVDALKIFIEFWLFQSIWVQLRFIIIEYLYFYPCTAPSCCCKYGQLNMALLLFRNHEEE